MPRKKKSVVIITGKTERQWIDEMRVLELAQSQGIKSPKIRTCYLCKREEGEMSLCLYEDREDAVSLKLIELVPQEIEIIPGNIWSYLLCPECSILLDAMTGTEPDDAA